MAGLIASLLTLVTGCERKVQVEDIRNLETPPPQPPNCPDTPELHNITLPSGRIDQVRILEFNNTKFYVPVMFIKSHFIRSDYTNFHKYGPVSAETIGLFQPYLMIDECPGIIHRHSGNIYGMPMIFLKVPEDSYPIIDSVLPSIDRIRAREFQIAARYAQGDRFIIFGTNSDPFARVNYNKDISVTFRWDNKLHSQEIDVQRMSEVEFEAWNAHAVQSNDWRQARKDVFDLMDWLATPPSTRGIPGT